METRKTLLDIRCYDDYSLEDYSNSIIEVSSKEGKHD